MLLRRYGGDNPASHAWGNRFPPWPTLAKAGSNGAGREALTSVAAIRTRLLAARLGSLGPEDLASLTAALPALRHLQEAWAEPNSTAGHRQS